MVALLNNETIIEMFFEMIFNINPGTLKKSGLSPIFFILKNNTDQQRTKRRTSGGSAKSIGGQQTQGNCYVRLTSNNGHMIGDYFILSSNALRNPFRYLTEALYEMHHPSHPRLRHKTESTLPEWLELVTEAINLTFDTILGFFTATGFSLAKYLGVKALRYLGHVINGDAACIKSESSLAEILGLQLEINSLLPGSNIPNSYAYSRHPLRPVNRKALRGRQPVLSVPLSRTQPAWGIAKGRGKNQLYMPQPLEFKNSKSFHIKGSFIQNSLYQTVFTLKYIYLYNGYNTLLLKIIHDTSQYFSTHPINYPSTNGTYYSYNTLSPLRQVYFDEATDTFHFDNDFSLDKGMPYRIVDGLQFIKIYNRRYQLIYDPKKQQYQVLIRIRQSKQTHTVPVYRERLSNRWHLSIYNQYPLFTKMEKELIDLLSIDLNHTIYAKRQNECPLQYGAGLLWYRKINNTIEKEKPLIEMHGRILPAQVKRKSEPYRCRYTIYDQTNKNGTDYKVEWDGLRWIFANRSSPQTSATLEKLITSKRFVHHLNASVLTPPNEYGLRQDDKRRSFLKVNNGLVRIHRVKIDVPRSTYNRFFIAAVPEHPRINLYFRDNLFHIETAEERIKRPFSRQLAANESDAFNRLKKLNWLGTSRAEDLLNDYQFPPSGFFSAAAFAIQIDQSGKLPLWANYFKKNDPIDPLVESKHKTQTIKVYTSERPSRMVEFNLGDLISSNIFYKLFLDHDDPRYVIKRYAHDAAPYRFTDGISYIESEMRRFRRYYGLDSAHLFHDREGNHYLRLYYVIGRSLTHFSQPLSTYLAEKLIDMLEKLALLGIEYGDLTKQDIIWNNSMEQFAPLDTKQHGTKYYAHIYRWNAPNKKLTEDEVLNLLYN